MSVAPTSTVWLHPKSFIPTTELVTVKLTFPPYTSLKFPSHCVIATPAKLDPVAVSRGRLAELGTAVAAAPMRPAEPPRVTAATRPTNQRRRLTRNDHSHSPRSEDRSDSRTSSRS